MNFLITPSVEAKPCVLSVAVLREPRHMVTWCCDQSLPGTASLGFSWSGGISDPNWLSLYPSSALGMGEADIRSQL